MTRSRPPPPPPPPPSNLMDDSALEGWKRIGCGGFSTVHKARHKRWCFDVAVKLLLSDEDGSTQDLQREAWMMRRGSCPYVLQVLGVFQGRPPSCPANSAQLGLVMELMERGSLASLQKRLRERPRWPLVLRMSHQVALGINFLHSLTPPLLHLDLKPSNVLLDPSLNTKLSDFGLAKIYHSSSSASRADSAEGGTIEYMPPEAFQEPYKPSKASDIYSYSILLWSILAWRRPYQCGLSSLVRLAVAKGQRPLLEELRSESRPEEEELPALIHLMERCWDGQPSERPTSEECATEAERVFVRHRQEIVDAVHQALTEMDSGTPHSEVWASGIDVPTGPSPVQEKADVCTGNHSDGSRLKGPSPDVRVPDTSPASRQVKPSSVHPPGRPSSRTSQPWAESATDGPAAANRTKASGPAAPGSESSSVDLSLQDLTLDSRRVLNSTVTVTVTGNHNTVIIGDRSQRRPASIRRRRRRGKPS